MAKPDQTDELPDEITLPNGTRLVFDDGEGEDKPDDKPDDKPESEPKVVTFIGFGEGSSPAEDSPAAD